MMDDDVQRPAARSLGSVAEAYHRGRPDFPLDAARWLAGASPATVLELGAGTGKLTAPLLELGHDVHATEPDGDMLAVLRRTLPDVPTSQSAAEEIPLADRSVDVVVAAQSFHWFDHERALPEIARVLRPGGYVAVGWCSRDQRIPWVRKLGQVLGSPTAPGDESNASEVLVRSELFGFVDEHSFHFWQAVDRESILDLALSRSYVASLDEESRAERLAEVREFYDDYGRGMDGMQLPYDCRCFRAQVVDRPDRGESAPQAGTAASPGTDRPAAGSTSDGTDTDMLLIDFR